MFQLAISDKVSVPVKGSVTDQGGKVVNFDFSITCDRKPQSEITELLASDRKTPDVMIELTSDWRGQRLVLDGDKKPVDFSPQAFEFLMEALPGMAGVCWNAYLQACGARGKEKN